MNKYGVARYEKNTKGVDIVTGDVHGNWTLLQKELDSIEFDPSVDRLFCVGDLVDRSPNKEDHKFLEWLEKPWFHSVRGNHEQLLIGHYLNDYNLTMCHLQNGGMWYSEWNLPQQTREDIYKACLRLPYIIEVETDNGLVGIIHADTGRENDWETFKAKIQAKDEKARETCLWSRMRDSSKDQSFITGISKVYAGHTPDHSVRTYGNLIVVDTGACFKGGNVTLLRIN